MLIPYHAKKRYKAKFVINNKMARIRLCPKCKNATLKSAVNVSGWLAPRMFECTSCDYIGSLFIEIDPKEIKKDANSYEGDTDTK